VEVLRGLPVVADPNVLVGTETADDAAVYRLDDKTAIVQTVDFFSPIVDDPYTFGQIAAANAISDIYAMGARPLFALAIAGFPRESLPLSVLHDILKGGADKAGEAGIPVVGGHTVDDAEPKYGLVVTGLVDPARVLRNAGARVGDQLVLTKPLGTGIVTNAQKKGQCPKESLDAAIVSMSALNRAGAEAMAEVPVSACTDVTGFGFVGHLRGMLEASGVSARILAKKLPVFPRVYELIAAGCVPGGSRRNQAWFGEHVDVRGASEAELTLSSDAQTSGGLLLSVPKERLEALLVALTRKRTLAAAHVGEIVDGAGGRIVLEG
jgi:selenium donor protein